MIQYMWYVLTSAHMDSERKSVCVFQISYFHQNVCFAEGWFRMIAEPAMIV